MKIKRFGVAAIALAAAGALTLSGCTSGGPRRRPAAGDSTAVITTNGTEPQNPLVPTNTNEVGGGKILDAIFAGLVYYDAEGAPHNDVAESIETDDAQNYTIKIKADQKFTNGEPVTAELVRRRLELRRTPLDNEQLSSYFFESIEGFSYDEDSRAHGPRGRRRPDLHGQAQAARVGLPAPPRLLGVLPAARVGLRGHRRVR